MSFSREYAHERAVRFQNAGKFLRVIGCKEVDENIHAFVFRGKIENACDGKTELSVLGGGVNGIAGDVNAVYGCAFAERLSDVRGVEAFSAARVQNDGIFFRVSADGFCHCGAQSIVKARAEKGASCVYHEFIVAVTDGSRLCGTKQIDVTLFGEVKAVIFRTHE
jgi:hypothetical protein